MDDIRKEKRKRRGKGRKLEENDSKGREERTAEERRKGGKGKENNK